MDTYNLKQYMTIVCALVEEGGYVSRGAADRAGAVATADLAEGAYDYGDPAVETTAEHEAEAEAVIAWARQLDPRNDYLSRLQRAMGPDEIPYRSLGYAASAAVSYARDRAREEERAREAAIVAGSQYQGQVGQPHTVTGQVLVARPIETRYGVSTLVKIADPDGNLHVWWASRPPGLQPGQQATLRGKVKRHETRDGVAQTILTRCRVA